MPTPPDLRPILVVYAHSAHHLSRVNRQLAAAARACEGVEVLDLYETYPDFFIDVPAEQARLERAAALVLVHPIQWYSMPALLKEWIDVVFKAGWAYGKGGTALAGKAYWLVATAGSAQHDYAPGALHDRPFEDYLPQFRQTAALCAMRWQEPLVLFGAHHVEQAAVAAHVDIFRARLQQLRATLVEG
ncbi:MAG: NAD(P)H-dependent oxidoreductase [Pseudomonadota bacterium]